MTPEDLVRVAITRRMLVTGAARRIRQQAGLTTGDFAKSLGVSDNTVRRWEAGDRRPCAMRSLAYFRLLAALEDLESES